MNKTTPRELFFTGEFIAGKYLAENGFEIIETNYRSPYGEIDIIAIKKNTLAFVEVKTRRKHSLELALANINYTKQKKISNTAYYYLNQNPHLCNFDTRFDVIIVFFFESTETYQVHHFENAFLPNSDF